MCASTIKSFGRFWCRTQNANSLSVSLRPFIWQFSKSHRMMRWKFNARCVCVCARKNIILWEVNIEVSLSLSLNVNTFRKINLISNRTSYQLNCVIDCSNHQATNEKQGILNLISKVKRKCIVEINEKQQQKVFAWKKKTRRLVETLTFAFGQIFFFNSIWSAKIFHFWYHSFCFSRPLSTL